MSFWIRDFFHVRGYTLTYTTSQKIYIYIFFNLAGMMLIRSDSGQMMLVSQQALAQVQQPPRGVVGQSPRVMAQQVCVYWSLDVLLLSVAAFP